MRGNGHGQALVRWLAERADTERIARIYLDSRFTAKGLYERIGFASLTSLPCWLDVRNYLARP